MEVDGAPCLEYSITLGERVASFWLDARSHCVRKVQKRLKGTLTELVEVRYSPHEELGQIPQSWTINWFGAKGKLSGTMSAEVESFTINSDIPATELDIAFPPRAHYGDARVSKEYEVREDGSYWEVDPLGERPVQPAEMPWLYRYRWALVGLCLFVAIVLYVVARVRRAQQ
jgi:hypothetical protein